MTNYVRAEPDPDKRDRQVFLYEDDGQTPAPIDAVYLGQSSTRMLSGTTGVLTGATVQAIAVGESGDTYTITAVADGAGAGSVTTSGGGFDVTFHFQAATTTVANMKTALEANGLTLTGTFTGSDLLGSPDDEFGPLALAAGMDAAVWVSRGPDAYGDPNAEGTLTSKGTPGSFTYRHTQDELDHLTNETLLRFAKGPDLAKLDMSTVTTNCDTIVGNYDSDDVGDAGNSATLEFVPGWAFGSGLLDDSAYPVVVFNYKSGVTTVGDFEFALQGSDHLDVYRFGTWTNVLVDPDDTFGPTNLADGRSYAEDIFAADMEFGSMDAIGSGSKTYGDMMRGQEALLWGMAAGFDQATIEFSNPDGSILRVRVTRDDTGRTVVEEVDLQTP